jgi:hypothetical protein
MKTHTPQKKQKKTHKKALNTGEKKQGSCKKNPEDKNN